jgi:predicted MFS family arabinose efflux permease
MTQETTRSDIVKYFIAVICMGFAGAMVDSSFNNFLKSSWDIGGLARSSLELPREIPGFLNVFVAAALAFLPGRRISALAFVFQAAGIALLGLFSPTFSAMTGWLFIYSLGQHVFLPLQQSVGMELAAEGGEGTLLGKANALKNLAQLAGGALVFVGFGFFGLTFKLNFLLTALVLLGAAVALSLMSAPPRDHAAPRLVLKKRYSLFYLLSILYGTRKQLFITFAPWVVVSVYGKPTSVVAALYFAGGFAGVVFQPIIGKAVDRLGERFMLGLEALILIPVCILYGLGRFLFPEAIAFAVVCVCYVVDSLLMSFGMARSVWLKKTAATSADIAPTLAMGISIDHVFSISVALVSGLVWDRFGYQWVFLSGALIAVVNFIATRWVRVGAAADRIPN